MTETLGCPGAFPSLDDEQLTDLGAPPVERPAGPRQASEVTTPSPTFVISPSDTLSHEQLEKKYGALSVCLRSDRRTTQSRLEQLRRKRDQSETNMMAELAKCREAVSMQAPANAQVQMQLLEAAARAAVYMVQAAEAYGAVQQEARVVNALDLLTQYVESLKHVHSKANSEQRNLLTASPSEPSPRTSRYGSLSAASASAPAASAKSAGAKRRASIAAMPRSATFGSSVIATGLTDDEISLRFGTGTGTGTGIGTGGGRPRRVSLQPKARTSISAIAVAAEATELVNDRMLECCGGGMAEIIELSESRRESAAGKSDEDTDDLETISARRPSLRIESDESPGDENDDAASEDDQLGKVPDTNLVHHQPMEQMSNGVVANSYPFLNSAFWRRGSIALTRRLSELRRNSYRAVRMSVSCCLLAAAAAVLVSTLLGGGATTATQRRRH